MSPFGRAPNGVIALWWTAFLISSFTGSYIIRATGGWFENTPPAPEDAERLYAVVIVSFIGRLIAASTLLVILGTITKHQRSAPIAKVFD